MRTPTIPFPSPSLLLAPFAAASLSFAAVAPPITGGSDSCATPETISGVGSFAFDTSAATTGPEGQHELACSGGYGFPLRSDVWFCWTAPSTDVFAVTTLNSTGLDTKIAVYADCGCPTSTAIACNDDACGTLQSSARFQAFFGRTYTIQVGVGSAPTAVAGAGSIDIARVPAPLTPGRLDDGASEIELGTDLYPRLVCWLQRFGTVGTDAIVDAVATTFGTPQFPAWTPPLGTPIDVLVWEDPNDDGIPDDAAVVAHSFGTVPSVSDDVFHTFPVTPVEVRGVYFVGISMQLGPVEAVVAMDTSVACGSTFGAWEIESPLGTIDFDDLANPANGALIDLGSYFGGVWMLRASVTTSTSRSFCGNDDAARMPCPCGDGTNPAAGCANSANQAGALLASPGLTQVDDASLEATGMTGSTCVFFRGLAASGPGGVPFGDGVSCVGGSILRLRTVGFSGGIAGTARFPSASDTVTLSARSGTAPGSGAVMTYGCFYRNAAAAFCTPATFNTANAIELTW